MIFPAFPAYLPCFYDRKKLNFLPLSPLSPRRGGLEMYEAIIFIAGFGVGTGIMLAAMFVAAAAHDVENPREG